MTSKSLNTDQNQLLHQISRVSVADALKILTDSFPGQVTFSTSFSLEDQVITHFIQSKELEISIFTLDTGRLFAETYSTWSATSNKYGTKIRAFYPDNEALESFVSENGPNAFYESIANRKQCCYLRKVEPLKRALMGNAIWITGLRSGHSAERRGHDILEWDAANQVLKYNPLLAWTDQEIRDYILLNDIPYNALHDRGFVSIGCAPCTRAIRPGEDFRAGRWWWEESNKKECGLHSTN
ncbi:MAG TPA: phosphoadenylyl-sulfate reductase [Puia sp.]|nr:phosphoadenylyl-sulfate reductase [Puia sp.]